MSQSVQVQVKPALPANLIVVLIAGVFAISSSSIFIRYTQAEGVPSLMLAALRLVIAVAILTPFVLSRYRAQIRALRGRDVLLALLAGLFLALHFATWVTSLEYTTVLISTVLVTTSPIWVALLEFLVLRTSLPRLVIVGLLIAIAGGLVIGLSGGGDASATSGNNDLLGASLSLAGAVCVAIYFIIGRNLRARLQLVPYIWLVYGMAGILLLVVALFSGQAVFGYSPQAYLFLLAMALFPQLVGHTSLNYAVAYVPATIVSMVTQLEPIGSAFLAFLLFQELPALAQVIGSAIILGGVLLSSLGQTQAPPPSQVNAS